MDNYLKEPKDRNSRILSLRNIQPPKENPSPTYETTNPIDRNFEEIEDPEALLNFINIEETRRNNENDGSINCNIVVELESIANTYDVFPMPKSRKAMDINETYKIEDSTQAITVQFFFNVKNKN